MCLQCYIFDAEETLFTGLPGLPVTFPGFELEVNEKGFDCIYDAINIVATSDQAISSHAQASDISDFQGFPRVQIEGTVGQMTTYTLDIKPFFGHNSSQHCSINQYRISKVVNSSTGE